MKIVAICKQDSYITFGKIAGLLKERIDIEYIAVTFNTRTARILSQNGSFSRIYNVPDYMRKNGALFPSITEIGSEIKTLDMNFPEDVLNKAISIDRLLFPAAMGTVYQKIKQYTYGEILRIIYGNCLFWQEIFHRERPDFIIGEIGNSSEYLAWAMCERYDCKYMTFAHARILKDRFFICDNPYDRVQKLENTFADLKERSLSGEERKGAESFLDDFIRKRPKPQYFGSSRNPFMPDIKRILRIASDTLARTRFPSDKSDRAFMLEDKDQLSFLGLFLHRAGKAVRYLSNLPLFDKIWATTDYFFFALHVQPELTTLLYGQFYDNQVAFVENICKCLPIGYRLVVKDHPGMVGRRTRNFYKELKKFPNVVLVAPEMDSHEIIRNAAGVITISGTVGLEGILYEKPVIVFGNTIYNIFDLVYKPNSFAELPRILRQAVLDFRPDRELLLKFLVAMEHSSYEGYFPDPVEDPEMLSPEKMRKIAEAIIAETQN